LKGWLTPERNHCVLQVEGTELLDVQKHRIANIVRLLQLWLEDLELCVHHAVGIAQHWIHGPCPSISPLAFQSLFHDPVRKVKDWRKETQGSVQPMPQLAKIHD
jgi:hypothetical protein